MTKTNTPLSTRAEEEKIYDKNEVRPFLLKPVCKDYLWGGDKLSKEYGKDAQMNPIAESWECSTHPDGISKVDSGLYKGMLLTELIAKYPEILGTHPIKVNGMADLPILVKLIDAGQNASIQVHPDDQYAYIHENGQKGKTEMWYILEAEPGARLMYGFYQDMEKETIRRALKEDDIERYVRKVRVKKDDVFFIEPGQVHAIGEGVLLAEIQQNSNITYRLYDYKRKDKDGSLRQLHVDKALDVAGLKGGEEPRQPMRVLRYQPGGATELLCRCKYFQAERVLINAENNKHICVLDVGNESFQILLCLAGKGTICKDEVLDIAKGNCIFIPAGSGRIHLSGNMQLLKIKC